jgi:hypothetical protein
MSGTANNFLQAVAAFSHSGFWAVGFLNVTNTGTYQTLIELVCRPQFSVAGPSSTQAAASFSLTVTATDPFGSVVGNYTGTVHFTSTDAQATLPSDYTFILGDAGSHTFSGVVLKTAGTQTITVTDAGQSDTNGSIAIKVTCSGACPAPAVPPAGRGGVKPAPPIPPGTRHPRAGAAERRSPF